MESLYYSPMLLGFNLLLASAVACTGLWYFSRPYRGPGLWMLGAWTLILGIVLFMGFMASGNKLLNVLGNATQLAGEAILLLGIFRFLGLPPPYWTVPLSAGLMALVCSWHWWLAPINSEWLVALYALIGGLLPFQACWALWRAKAEPELRGARNFVALALFGYACVTLLRAGIGLQDGWHGVEHSDVTRSFSYLLPYNFGIPLWVIALVGLTLMTMRRILADSQRHATQAQSNAERFERLMRVANAGMLVLEQGRIIDSNPMLEQMLGRSRAELLNQPLASLFNPAHQGKIAQLLQQADGRPHDVEALRSPGRHFPAELSVATLDDSQQQVAEVRNVTHRKVLEDKLRRLASTDPLTAALNRRAFAARAKPELERSQRHQSPLCLAALDLDHFKRVNDQHGHAMGDQVLREFSQLCRQVARSTDLFARFGGEEFVFLLPDTELQAARQFLERLREALQNLPFTTADGSHLHISVSIGVAQYQAGSTLQLLQEAADHALYNAKQNGRNRVEMQQ